MVMTRKDMIYQLESMDYACIEVPSQQGSGSRGYNMSYDHMYTYVYIMSIYIYIYIYIYTIIYTCVQCSAMIYYDMI